MNLFSVTYQLNDTTMNKTMRILMLLALALLLVPGEACAQKKKSKARKRTTTAVKTYPARDDTFLPDYQLQPIGDFTFGQWDLDYTVLPTPYFEGHVLKRDMKRPQVRLKQLSCTPNDITDDEAWFERIGATSNEYRYEGDPMGEDHVRFRISTNGYHVFFYGPTWGHAMKMIITDAAETKLYRAYDFSNYMVSPGAVRANCLGATQSLNDVIIEGNIMYIVFATNTYKESTKGETGYIAAIDLRNDETIWTTQPMTAGWKMAIEGNSIITGYGMTDEPDYVHVVDKYSGQRVQRIWVKKSPSYVVIQGRKAYVRTYSFDYVFGF